MIEILLATLNSAAYLEQTLQSILNQDYPHWRLLIRDDGSQDCTLELIQNYLIRYPDQMILIVSEEKMDPRRNFSILLEQSTAPYIMFCDHDDIWLPDKISKSLSRLKQREVLLGPDHPILLFSDKQVVDEDLTLISPSDFRYQKMNPYRLKLRQLLVQNIPSGCTILMNRALANLCIPIPTEASMHDHWCSLCAAAFGEIIYLDEPTILYRQHDRNIVGTAEYGWKYCLNKMLDGKKEIRARYYLNTRQAGAFYQRFKNRLPNHTQELLWAFSSLPERNWYQRRKILLKYGIWKSGFRRNAGMLLIV